MLKQPRILPVVSALARFALPPRRSGLISALACGGPGCTWAPQFQFMYMPPLTCNSVPVM